MEDSYKEAEKELIILYKDVYLSYIINLMIKKKFEEILELYKKLWFLDNSIKSKFKKIEKIVYDFDPYIIKLSETEKGLLSQYRASNINWALSEAKKISLYENVNFVPREEKNLDTYIKIAKYSAFFLIMLRVVF